MAYEDKETEKAVWNMDDSVLKTLWFLKNTFIMQKQEFKLESAYWTLRNIWMEVEAKFSKKEREKVKEKVDNLETVRKEYLKNNHNNSGTFYIELENVYISLNRLMASNGLYFRESDEDDGL